MWPILLWNFKYLCLSLSLFFLCLFLCAVCVCVYVAVNLSHSIRIMKCTCKGTRCAMQPDTWNKFGFFLRFVYDSVICLCDTHWYLIRPTKHKTKPNHYIETMGHSIQVTKQKKIKMFIRSRYNQIRTRTHIKPNKLNRIPFNQRGQNQTEQQQIFNFPLTTKCGSK